MRALLGALAIVGAFTAAASAEPLKLDEASLGEVLGGFSAPLLGPITIGIDNMIATPVAVENNIDVDNQIGYALALNTNAVIAALSTNVSGMGTAAADTALNPGVVGVAP